MGDIQREDLPEPVDFYASEGIALTGRGRWRSGRCTFHGGSDSFRVNIESGGFICMSCGVKGGNAIDFVMQAHGLPFVEAAQRLGVLDIKEPARRRRLPARDALELLYGDALLVLVAAGNVAQGVELTKEDRTDLAEAVGRIGLVRDEVFA